MSALSLRRLALLLLIIVPVLILQCTTVDTNAKRGGLWKPHTKYWQPDEIAVDVARLSASPRVTVVFDVAPEMVGDTPIQKPSQNPVKITWRANDPNFKLGLQIINDCPIPAPECHGPSCTVVVPPFKDRPNAKPYRCTYELKNLSKVAQVDQDSDIIIVPCCM